MKKYFIRSLATIAIGFAGLGNIASAQSNYKIEETKDVDMKLRGTSTLHKWEMDAKTVEGEAQFDMKPENKLSSLKSLSFALEVTDLKSDSKGLDKNAYKALKSAEHKDIHYRLTSAVTSSEKEGKYLLKTNGKLTIAGVTKEIAMDVYCLLNKDGTITCTGSYKLNMTDYKVKPPTFMLGAMKTGDAIMLDFVIVYKKQKGV
jgi:polyisoprenoid-binding protein YceI